jgi:hypothetical protein
MTYAFHVCFGKNDVTLVKFYVCLFLFISLFLFFGFCFLGGEQIFQNQLELGLHQIFQNLL